MRDNCLRRIIELMVLMIVMVFTIFCLTNNTVLVEDILFSYSSGYYDDPFYLELNCQGKNNTIYYTTDGSIPDKRSNKYREEILIDKACGTQSFTLSRRTDVSGLNALGIDDYFPEEFSDNAVLVNARVLNYNGLWGKVNSELFVFASDEKSKMSLPIVSIIVDQGAFLNMYTNGDEYEKAISDYHINNDWTDAEVLLEAINVWQKANWSDRTKFVLGDISIIESQQTTNRLAKFKINGSYSRIFPQKSLGLYFGENGIKNNLFHETDSGIELPQTEYSFLKLRNGGSKNMDGFLNDYIIQSLSSGLLFDTQAQKMCVVYINGEYWGLYQLCEKYKEDYFGRKYGINKEDILMVKESNLEIGDDISPWLELIESIKSSDMKDEKDYRNICKKIDMISLIQLYAANIYFSNIDFVGHNQAQWTYYDKESNTQSYWKWMMFDCDSTFENHSVSYLMDTYLENDIVFQKLYDNNDFKETFLKEYSNLIYNQYSNERMKSILDDIEKQLKPYLSDYYNRFGPQKVADMTVSEQLDYFHGYLEEIMDYTVQRNNSSLEELEYYVGKIKRIDDYNSIFIDFTKNGNSRFINTYNFYDQEEEGSWAKNDASVSLMMECSGDLVVDISDCSFMNHTSLLFNGIEVWNNNDNTGSIITVPYRYIKQRDCNTLMFSTDEVINSPKELGISDDPRELCFWMKHISLSKSKKQESQ